MSTFDNWPIGVAVHNDKVVNALVMKVIGAYALEGVRGLNGWVWRCAGLGGCHAVAIGTIRSGGYDGGCDSWPENRDFSPCRH